jgi:(E)-4-hydroxy-3-methyl-but-2-enyl pyrophosphate reductase
MIHIAEVCGFCAGSAYAFTNTLKTIKDNPGKRIVLFKKLLHNQDALDFLMAHGAVQIDEKENFKPEDIIIIRAHGETKETLKYVDECGIKYIDCTCRKVQRIHTAIEEKYNAGYTIFIIGEKNDHPEVIGSHSRCNNEGYIITAAEDINAIPGLSGKKIFVAAQTTVAREKFDMLSETIKNKFAACDIEFMDSLCDLQERIQTASVKLAAQCGTMIVIGGKDSSNTKALYEKCRAECPHDTRCLETKKHFYDEIVNGKFDFSREIGITGGASTPAEVIKECQQLLMFRKFYEETRKKIREKVRLYDQMLLQNNNPFFQDAIEQFAAIGESEKAKFIRGCLLALGYRTAQEHNENYSLDLAAAYELFETSILVHDDVFDKAKHRRDVTTIHEKIAAKYPAGCKDDDELIQFNAQSIAVCTGDLGFYFANQMILNAYRDDKNLAPVLKCFNDIVIKTIKGELLDIVLPLEERLRIPHGKNIEDCVFEIDATKTAEYTTIGPFCLGLTLGGASREDLQKFTEMLRYLGIAFQIQDDYLNIYGKQEQGKPIGNDIAEYKMTLFYAEICKNEELKKQLLNHYGKENLTAEDLETVRNIFEKAGAREKINRIKTEYFEKCRGLLDVITFNREENKDILFGFIHYIELRSR